jgi:hypothetical protein
MQRREVIEGGGWWYIGRIGGGTSGEKIRDDASGGEGMASV